MFAYLCPLPSFTSQVIQSDWLNDLTGEWGEGGLDLQYCRCASPLISFLQYSEAWEVNSHCLIDVPTRNCCATVPTGHSCLLYWLISLSTQSTNWLQLCDDFRLQKQRAAGVLLDYLHIAHCHTGLGISHCVAHYIFYCYTKCILYRRTLNLGRKLRCDTAYWQHCSNMTYNKHQNTRPVF